MAESRTEVGKRGHLRLQGVSKTYAGHAGSTEALKDVDLDIRPGEVVSCIGPSGCGKSTLLKVIAGLIPSNGEILVDGEAVRGPHHDIGMMFQTSVLLPWRTVLSNVLLPARIHRSVTDDKRRRALELLAMVGVADFADALPRELSGGMQQRVALCRVLLEDPHILLLDEPFAALDEFTRERLNLELLAIQQETGKTVIFVTHNVIEATFLSDRVVVMSSRPGRVHGVVDVDLPRPRTVTQMRSTEFSDHVFAARSLLDMDGGLPDGGA